MSDSLPIEHPEQSALRAEIDVLRTRLAERMAEEHELLVVVKPNLLALYQRKLGAWELRRLQAEVEVRGMRRRIELAQAAINRSTRPDWPAIEAAIEEELLRWKQQVSETIERIAAAELRLGHLLSPEDASELKRLHRSLVLRLHPDLDPTGSSEQRRALWDQVQRAYEQGDVEGLRALDLVIGTDAPTPSTWSGLESLRQEKERLGRQLATIEDRCRHLLSQAPWSMRDSLEDPEWIAARRADADARIAQLEAERSRLEPILAQLLPSTGYGRVFGSN